MFEELCYLKLATTPASHPKHSHSANCTLAIVEALSHICVGINMKRHVERANETKPGAVFASRQSPSSVFYIHTHASISSTACCLTEVAINIQNVVYCAQNDSIRSTSKLKCTRYKYSLHARFYLCLLIGMIGCEYHTRHK